MRTTTCLGVLLAMFAGPSAWSQTLPDAGSLMRQNEQMFRPNPANTARREALAPPMTLDANTVVAVKRIQFAGHKHLSLAQLRQIATPYEGRTLSGQDLQHLTYAVSEAYRQVGWVVQAYVPRQNLHTGDLLVQIIETVPPSSAP